MKRFCVIIIFLGLFAGGHAQEDLSVNGYWLYNGEGTNALYSHISSLAFAQLEERRVLVAGMESRNDWAARQADVRKKLVELIGEFPEKTPLNTVITGKIKKDGFTVEKLYFESRPGYRVTAALFVPASKKGKQPAIIYCSGHLNQAFRAANYQKSILNLVKKGFIVLAFDPIGQGERIQYFDANGKSIFKETFEHSYPGTQSFVCGRAPANYFVWDGIRAVDYLIGRKEVDPARIGITGISGGGTQTSYIAAMDDRIAAAAPVCYITSFDKLLRSRGPQDAEQILMYAIEKGFDMGDLIEVRAPKPTLLVATTRDIFSIQGTRDVFREAQKAYTALGAPENISMAEDDDGHALTKKNREAVHAFFQKFLNNPGDPKEEDDVELLDEKDLWVTPTGQLHTSLKGEDLYSLNEQYAAEASEKLQLERQNPDFHKAVAQKAKSLTGYSEPALSKDYIFSGRSWRDGYSVEKYLLKGAGNYYIPVLRLAPGKFNGKTILLLDDRGKADAVAQDGLADRFVQKGYQVIVPDLNGIGELAGGYKSGDAIIQGVPLNIWYAGVLTRKTPLAVRVEEIKIITGFIKELGLLSKTLTGISCGTLSSELLHAAVIGKEFDNMALINPLASYRSIVQERNYHTKFVMSAAPGIIGTYDVPDLVAAASPAKIYMLNPVNSIDQAIDAQKFKDIYATTPHLTNLNVDFNAKDIFSKVNQWIDDVTRF